MTTPFDKTATPAAPDRGEVIAAARHRLCAEQISACAVVLYHLHHITFTTMFYVGGGTAGLLRE